MDVERGEVKKMGGGTTGKKDRLEKFLLQVSASSWIIKIFHFRFFF